jgi:hypothetical protein
MDKHRPHHLAPTLGSARIALVYKSADKLGYSPTGLGIVATQTAKALRAHGIWAEPWACPSGEALLERLRHADAQSVQRQEVEPTQVVVYAPWIATELLAHIADEFPNVVFVVTSHSNFGFLAADPHAVKLMRETAELQLTTYNVRVGGNCRRFTDAAAEVLCVDVTWLPNLLPLGEHWPRARSSWAGDCLRLGLFGAARILKNGLTAAAAACELAQTLRVPTELHVTADRDDGGTYHAIEELCDGVPHLKLVRVGWLPWPGLLRLTGHMHLVLQPSFTESFNCVAAEAVRMGVPVVGSHAIDWLPKRWQADSDDADDVARVAEYLIKSPHVVEDGRVALQRYMALALDRWRKFACPNSSRLQFA